ncbi:MAG: protein kinase [Gammaproteobacteria bacterium]|nr:protein kinase [Gammaproteobacteria bacterium]
MADFKTALEALGAGKLDASVLAKQIEKLLNTNPRFATKMLTQLDEARDQKQIDDTTVFAQDGAAADDDKTIKTEAPAAADESTQVLTEEEKADTAAAQTDASGVDFDISATSHASSEATGGTGPAGTGFEAPQPSGGTAPGKELGVGDVIKQRFKLLGVLGIGGMGKVFKAIDLLKEEAKDKKPYVAIKLLNEDFKDHPEAFISLQRESSRQQKLAHPNIATIYDFDRVGGPGTPVYITMELMEGMELKDFIKKKVKKQGGLPFDEAFKIIEQLGAGLTYAHDLRLVHSDFKPGNAFYCNDGTVKTLDFGIARAVKNPVTGEVEKTLFDPGQLGALTPAYASLEMLEGEEPDTRDDTYALGCVCYELLTGKHPFNKLPATTDRDNGLVPAPVKGLNKKQNRALRRSVAFKREDRSPTVEHFIDEVQGKATWHKNPFVIAAGVLIVVSLILINPALDYFHDKEIESIVVSMNSASPQQMVATLNEVRDMEQSDRTRISADAKVAIQDYFSAEIAQHINTSGEDYNFPKANEVLAEVNYFYPESVFLQEQTDEVETNKKQKVADLYQDYIAALDPKAAQDDPLVIDTTKNILEIIRTKIDPAHPLLEDPRPSNAYRLAAEEAFDSRNYEQALTFVSSGLSSAPDDARLTDLQTKISNAITVAQLNESLGSVQSDLVSLESFDAHQENIIKLASLSSAAESPVLKSLSDSLKTQVDNNLSNILKDGSRADAEALVSGYGVLLSALELGRELVQVKLAHLSGDERVAAIQEFVTSDKATVEEKLAAPALDDQTWESELLASIRQLDSLQSEDKSIASDLQSYRETIGQLYVEQATSTLEEGRFDAAESFVSRAERFAPQLPLLLSTRNTIASTKAEFEKQARIKDLKEQFAFQTDADRVTEANKIFEQLQSLLPANDPFITSEASEKLAASYSRLAQRRADRGEYGSALKLSEAGLKLAPADSVLKAFRNDFRVEVNIAELSELFSNAITLDVVDVTRKVNQIENGAPARYTDFRKQAETTLENRVRTLAATDKNAAAGLLNAAVRVFATNSVLSDLLPEFGELEPWPDSVAANQALSDGNLSSANNLLQSAAGEFAGHPDVLNLQRQLESSMKDANEAYDEYLVIKSAAGDSFKDLREAKRSLNKAKDIWSDNPDYKNAESDINRLIAAAPDNPANRVMKREEVDIAAVAPSNTDSAANKVEWTPAPSGRECTANLAGHGKRSKAICYDLVFTGWRGPLMVVVPAGEISDKPFAIGKYEVSVGDWSKYCALSGRCKPETNKEKHNDPQTGITMAQAKEFTDWLSERTGKKYRIPSKAEWEYAATAGGKQPKKDWNCRLVLNGKMLKGTGIASVKFGQANGWGLKNYIGNVQELVEDGGSTIAAGGAYSDQCTKSDISLQRPHSGAADETTGFRLILEDIG